MNKILDIVEADRSPELYGYYNSGYVVKTEEGDIKLLINNGQSCCEDWGYYWSSDTFEDFIGEDLLSIDLVDNALVKTSDVPLDALNAGGALFINLNTSFGVLQFVMYNSHNGYYGHSVLVDSKWLKVEDVL